METLPGGKPAASPPRPPPPGPPWWQTLPGTLTAFAGVVMAIAGLSTLLREPAQKAAAVAPATPAAPAVAAGPASLPTTVPMGSPGPRVPADGAASRTPSQPAIVQAPDGDAVVRGRREDKASQIAVLADGTAVQVLPSDETWQQVLLPDGRTGYMHRARLKPVPAPAN